MSRSRLSRKISALCLALVLCASWSLAAAARQGSMPMRAGSPAASWSALTHFWRSLTSLWAEAGCSLDPDGRCFTGSSQLNTDNGCSADPNGRCITVSSQPKTDAGCTADPDGRCL